MKHLAILLSTFLFLTACGGPSATEGSALSYKVDGGTYEGYFISAGTSAPLVLLIHDWDGVTDYEIKRASMLAAEGYSVFCADLFGQGVRPAEIDEKKKLTGALYADRPRMRALMEGALKAAASQGADTSNAVVMGYCFGGACALELARMGSPLKGFVSFHGGLATPEGQDYKNVKGPVLVLHGSADANIPLTEFATLGQQLEAAHVPHEMITYSGAPHAFTVFGSDRYREGADAKSWARFLEFLREWTR
ncbi:MAG: dienelactone hydrolase family protein [Planctomycetota bacterium]